MDIVYFIIAIVFAMALAIWGNRNDKKYTCMLEAQGRLVTSNWDKTSNLYADIGKLERNMEKNIDNVMKLLDIHEETQAKLFRAMVLYHQRMLESTPTHARQIEISKQMIRSLDKFCKWRTQTGHGERLLDPRKWKIEEMDKKLVNLVG